MLVPCLQCKSPVFVSGSAVAAGDVRSTCGNCGTALVVERGGVVRLAEPPPGPAAAPQLIVPPTFEPPSHATTMREYATADEQSLREDASSTFYVARQPPVGAQDFNALLGADVRAYIDDGHEARPVEPPQPTFSGPASFGSDQQSPLTQDQDGAADPPTPQVLPDFAPPELLPRTNGPELTPPEQTFVPADADHTPINVPHEVPSGTTPVAPFETSDPPGAPSPKLMTGESHYEPPVREKPPALMFPAANVSGMSGPAREAEQTRLAPVMREQAPPLSEPVLLTAQAPPPELLDLTQEMPEWSGESLGAAVPYAAPFAAPVSDDEIDGALGSADRQRRSTYPTPDSYFDTSDPLAAAEADMYAGHQVVAPTELVGDAFAAMVPPVGTEIPHDTPTIDQSIAPPAAKSDADAALAPEELAVLGGGKRQRFWAAVAVLVFAVGGASFAASRGYLDALIVKVSAMMGREPPPDGTLAGTGVEAPKPAGAETVVSETPKADAIAAEAHKVDQAADGQKVVEPKPDAQSPDAAKAEQPLAAGANVDTTKADTSNGASKPADSGATDAATKAALVAPDPATDNTPPIDAKPAPTPSKAMQACYAKGNRLLNAKKVNLAIRELNKCLDIDPTYGRTYRSLGVAYMQLGRERSAILAYEKFVDYDAQHKDVAKVREIIADYYRRRKN